MPPGAFGGLIDGGPGRIAASLRQHKQWVAVLDVLEVAARDNCNVANDLEEPAFLLRPELREYKKLMSEAGLWGVCLSGSGSTLFGFLPPALKKQDITGRLSHLPARFTFTKLKESNRFGLVS